MRELPFLVSLGVDEGFVAVGKIARLERTRFGTAVHAHDAAARALDYTPFLAARHRIAIDLAQIALHGRHARVLQQVLQLHGISLRAARRAVVIGGDRIADLVAGEQQLRLLVPLLRMRGQLPHRGEHRATDCYRDEQREIDEAFFTSSHSPWHRCARRRRRLFADRWAERRARSWWPR